MKAILISIRSKHVKNILSYIKKIEVRKPFSLSQAINKLIEEQGIAPMLIYCTKGKDKRDSLVYVKHDLFDDSVEEFALNGRVVARFNATCDDYVNGKKWVGSGIGWGADNDYEAILKDMCLTEDELYDYCDDLSFTAIHINDLKVFDRPKLLTEFNRVKWDKCGVKDKNGLYQCHKCPYAIHYGHGFGDCGYDKPIKAPQSWMYVEF